MRVAVGAAWKDLDHGDALADEEGVERGGVFRIPVPDQVGELGGAVAELPEKLACLLGGPGCGGVGGDAEDVDGAGVYFHDEQGVQALQSDRVDVEQVGGEQAVGLGLEEGGPFAACRVAAWCGAEAGSAQDTADGCWADLVSEAAQFAVHATGAPAGVVGARRVISSRSSCGRGGRPADRGWVHFCLISRWCQASSVRGETMRWQRSARGSSPARADSSARSGQSGL